ncbi:MAG: thioredoxin, partial [Myxococcota bacterium]
MSAAAAGPAVVDVGDADFAHEVIEHSSRVPVIVDFWAPWCGPCRQLGPALERAVNEQAGALRLAKVNVDQSPQVARQFGVQSIPLVLAFRDGKPVAEFVGAQPEAVLKRFVASLLPSNADRLVREAAELLEAGHANAAEERLRAALAEDARHPQALLGLARVLGERGEGFIELSAAGMAREHWERLAELSGAPIIYQALPASGLMLEMHEQLFAWFRSCQERGLRIYGQGITQNPPLVFSFDYWDLWGPVWQRFAGPDVARETKLANLEDPAVREKLRAE